MDNAKLDRIKNNLEKELGTEISEDICTSCARLSFIQFKVVHRLHWRRAKIASFYPSVDRSCIRCHVNMADLTHMFWSCHLLTGYWSDIFVVLSNVLGVTLQPCAMIALFGVPNEETSMTKN